MGRRISALDLPKLRKFLERIGCRNKLLALEITYGGMACGPVWYSDVYGFDYETVDGEESCTRNAGFLAAASPSASRRSQAGDLVSPSAGGRMKIA
ncbi:MAG: hypothetical protein IPF66_19650 [Holophagales bacterium]|nr:hypothetical protein [Holophagales bacterium]